MSIIDKIKNIGIGWGRWVQLLDASKKVKQESIRRLEICDGCEYATASKFLEMISGKVEHVHGKFCKKCMCPCHQKSLTDEMCPLGKWDL